MTFLFFIVEIVFGYISHSMALIADSFHMLSDVMALGIAFVCMRVCCDCETELTIPIYFRSLSGAPKRTHSVGSGLRSWAL